MSRTMYLNSFEKELISIIQDNIGLVNNLEARNLLALSVESGCNVYSIVLAHNLFPCQNFSAIFITWKDLYSYRLNPILKIEEQFIKVLYTSSRLGIYENKTH
jgi:hypothetical protein